MRDSEKTPNRSGLEPGERSTAEGEVQPPNAAPVDDSARIAQTNERADVPRDVVADRRHEANADMGSEGTANTSPAGGKPERKPRA